MLLFWKINQIQISFTLDINVIEIDFSRFGKDALGDYVMYCKIRDGSDKNSDNYIIKGVTELRLL